MSIQLNSEEYERLIREDITWLRTQPNTCERRHIEAVLIENVNLRRRQERISEKVKALQLFIDKQE